MNLTDVINDIKVRLGLNAIALPFEQPTENVIREILKGTIRTYSQFKPQIREGYCLKRQLKYGSEFDKHANIFILPPELTLTPVQYAEAYQISSVIVDGQSVMNGFTTTSPFVGFGSYYPQDIVNAELTGAAINKFLGVTTDPSSSKWLGYNKIQLFNFPDDCTVAFRVSCDHDEHAESIPVSCRESFMELAMLDVQIALYSILKNMNQVGSAFKEISLKIDDWAGAEAARTQLVDKWTEIFHYDQPNLITFF